MIACRSGAELAETALLLVEQPLPAGLRVCIVSNTGGVGALATDRADGQGMVVAPTSDELRDALPRRSPARSTSATRSTSGPTSRPGGSRTRCVDVLEADEADAVLVLLVANRLSRPRRAASRPSRSARRLGRRQPGGARRARRRFDAARGLPASPSTARPMRRSGRLGRAMRYAAWRRVADRRPDVELGTRGVHARAWARSRLAARSGEAEWLPADAGRAAGAVRHPPRRPSRRRTDRRRRSRREIGYPVVVKVADPTVLHKSDRGLVRVDVRPRDDVAEAVERFAEELGHDRVDVLVQPLRARARRLAWARARPAARAAGPGRRRRGTDRSAAGPRRCSCCRRSQPADAARAVRALRLWPQLVGDQRPGAGGPRRRSRRW